MNETAMTDRDPIMNLADAGGVPWPFALVRYPAESDKLAKEPCQPFPKGRRVFGKMFSGEVLSWPVANGLGAARRRRDRPCPAL